MLEILAVLALMSYVGRIVAKKGYAKGKYQLMTAGLWIGGEIAGAVIGLLITGNYTSPGLGAYVIALIGAAIGAAIAYAHANNLPVIGEPIQAASASVNPAAGIQPRPGCVSVYAVLLAIGAIIIGLGGFVLGSDDSFAGGGAVVVIAIALVWAVLQFLLARGLWRQKNWARILIVIIGALSAVINLLAGCAARNSSATVSGIASGLVMAFIAYWFATHREYFE
jgi:hypothetical protein